MSAELCLMSASEALARFRDRSLSPTELMEAVIARADAVDPTVNALCHRFSEAALVAARAAEARCGAGTARPLEGLPVAIKEEEPVAGQPWTQGSLTCRDLVASYSSTFAQRHLDAGAIVHARTTAPEFSCAGFTHSRIHGVTRNPSNPALAVGGSSGGSAASLASGTSALASGSDIAGSIRMPAAACGVVGYKPPYGRVPVDPAYNLDTYCHDGPLARTVADCALYENVLAGPAADDIASLRDRVVLPRALPDVAGLRVALSVDLGDWPVEDDVAANARAVADALRTAGAVVEEVDLTVSRADVMRALAIHFAGGFAADIGAAHAAHPELVCDYVVDKLRWVAETVDGADHFTGQRLEAKLWRPVGELLERYDALVCATSCVAGLDAGESYVQRPLLARGEPLPFYLENFLTPVFNVMSRCPVLAIPSGRGARGAPTGVQIVGHTYDDLTVFRLGAAVEAVRPWDDWPAEIVA